MQWEFFIGFWNIAEVANARVRLLFINNLIQKTIDFEMMKSRGAKMLTHSKLGMLT